MIVFYREDNGDYLAIDTATNAYYRTNFGKDHFEGRATAIAAAGRVGMHHGGFEGLPQGPMPTSWKENRADGVAKGNRVVIGTVLGIN